MARITNWLWGPPQPARALPSGRTERDRGGRKADAPLRPWARPEPQGCGQPAAELPSRDSRAPALSAPEPATIVHHPGSQGSPRRPCPHPEAVALSGRGLRCPAVASPRPAAAVGQRGVPRPRGGRGGSARAARPPGRSSLGAPPAPTASGGSSGAPLRGTGARRGATAAARQRARGSCPAATGTGRREPLSPGAPRIPSALPPASGRRSGRRPGAHPGGAAAVPPAADFVEVRRGPRAAGAGAAPRGGWSGHRRNRCGFWQKRCWCCRCQQGTRNAGDSVLLLYLPADLTSAPSAATPGAALPGPGAGGNPHPTTAVFLFPFKIRLALSNFDSCFENSVNLRFWVLF